MSFILCVICLMSAMILIGTVESLVSDIRLRRYGRAVDFAITLVLVSLTLSGVAIGMGIWRPL